MKRMKTSDYMFGTLLGVLVVIIVGRLLHPDMSILEILKIIVKSQIGWSW